MGITGPQILQPSPTRETPPERRTGRLGLVVIGSTVTGLVVALALVLVVFSGAPEHVIMGAAMLGFAVGWAMLALLSKRRTHRPQGWAFVPAGFLGAVGAALLVLAPGNDTLTAMSWVWPPFVLALAAWMGVQVRRARMGRSRWLLYPIVALLALGAVGGIWESAALARDESTTAMPGTAFDVGGHRLHLNCTGSGAPTVVLENGLGETASNWSRIAPGLSRTTRVCAYDRAGQGWSDDAAGPQDGLAVAAELHTLLGRAGIGGPYVLVGHSTGGAYAMTYAARYPREVAGMVLLDSASPHQFTALPDYPAFYALARPTTALLPSLGRLGMVRLVSAFAGSTPAGTAPGRAFGTSARDMRSQRDELAALPEVFTQAQALTTLGGEPLVVVTATEGQQRGWATAQDELAALSTNSSHRLVPATHESLLSEPGDVANSLAAVQDVVRSVRSGSSVPAR
jgi:pimeloyl-ACP methyl ester carboxylesterase